MSPSDVYWHFLTVVDVLAVVFNSFLIYLALYRTPRLVRVYTTLIINLAVTDGCSALLNFFVQQRMIPAGFMIAYVSRGWCTSFGKDVCWFSYNLMAHLIVHSNYSLLLSFAYRYYILRKPEPSRKTVLVILFITYLPSFTQLVLYEFAQSDQSAVLDLLKFYHPDYEFFGLTVTGITDIRSVFALFKILQMTVMTVPIFTLILLLRRKIINRLMFRGINISLNTKSLHSQLLLALTYQSLLPTLYSISVVCYVLEQSGLYSSVAIENYILSGLVLVPVLSPFTSFFFFTPYKRFILGLIGKNSDKRRSGISESVVVSMQI